MQRPNLSKLLLVLILMSILGCARDPTASEANREYCEDLVTDLVDGLSEVNARSEVDVEAIVANAVDADRAVMFLHVDWSFMNRQRNRFADFACQYHQQRPASNVLFHYVDCTPITSGYRPLHKLTGWRELQRAAGTSLIHGWGEVVWLQNGRVLHVQRILDFSSTTEIIEFTNRLFQRDDLISSTRIAI